MKKTCSYCRGEKDAAEFHRRAASPDGLSYRCKQCESARGRARGHRSRPPDPVRLREYNRRYYQANRARLLASRAARYGAR